MATVSEINGTYVQAGLQHTFYLSLDNKKYPLFWTSDLIPGTLNDKKLFKKIFGKTSLEKNKSTKTGTRTSRKIGMLRHSE